MNLDSVWGAAIGSILTIFFTKLGNTNRCQFYKHFSFMISLPYNLEGPLLYSKHTNLFL